jgi:hypothetical protein
MIIQSDKQPFSLILMWEEVVQLASTVSLDDSDGALIWKFSSNGVYSVQSLYKVINFRGIKPILVSSILEVMKRNQFNICSLIVWCLSNCGAVFLKFSKFI